MSVPFKYSSGEDSDWPGRLTLSAGCDKKTVSFGFFHDNSGSCGDDRNDFCLLLCDVDIETLIEALKGEAE
jgi:hypothetical protein